MIKLERTVVMGMEPAIRGMRNPMNSWDKSDSVYCTNKETCEDCPCATEDGCVRFELDPFIIGPNDHDLAMRLIKGGPVEAKFRRQIFVSVDITAPLYWWKEFDTYKVGTVANSCSTMHKIHAKEFVLDDFSHEHLMGEPYDFENDDLIIGEFESTGLALVASDVNGWLGHCYHTANGNKCLEYLSPKTLLENYIIGALNANREAYLKTGDKKYWYQMIQLLPTSYNQMRTITFNYEVLAGMYKSRKNHKLQEWRDMCEWMLTLPYPEFITGRVSEDGSVYN